MHPSFLKSSSLTSCYSSPRVIGPDPPCRSRHCHRLGERSRRHRRCPPAGHPQPCPGGRRTWGPSRRRCSSRYSPVPDWPRSLAGRTGPPPAGQRGLVGLRGACRRHGDGSLDHFIRDNRMPMAMSTLLPSNRQRKDTSNDLAHVVPRLLYVAAFHDHAKTCSTSFET